MTDDLVKRLRENDFFREDTLYWVVDTGKADALCNQAADHIEALTAENERLREALSELADLMDDVCDGKYQPDSFTTQPARAALGGTQ